MAFLLFQSGSSLQCINQSGTLSTLTLPTGVTLQTDRPPRFAVYGRFVVMTNTPTVPITVDADGICRVLTPKAPEFPIVLDDDGGAGNLTGDYFAWQTYIIRDESGNLIAESDYSPDMPVAFTASSDLLNAESLNVSQEAVSASRIYRSTAGGTAKFRWLDVDGTSQTTSDNDDTADATLDNITGPTLGSAPDLILVANWRERLWGVDRVDVDALRFTEAGVMYSWPAANERIVGREGSDKRGITALLARRDALGVGRREGLFQVTGTSNTDLRVVIVSEQCGVESQETVIVWKDIAYFLWKDGVYAWGPEGLQCISDGKVRAWFTTDTYFNRGRFQYAFAGIDPINNKYRLFLANTGDSVENRWVEYDIKEKTWWGPHKTDAVTTLTCATLMPDSNDNFQALIGNSTGYFWKDQTTATDDTATGIALDVDTKFYDGNTPDIEKYWGELSMLGKAQSAGTLTITPKVGWLNASTGTAISYTMSNGRQRLRRLGMGKLMQLNLTHSTAAQPVELYGLSIPFHEIGRR